MGDRRLRVAFFQTSNFHGGTNRFTSEIATALAERGHEVSVCVPVLPQWMYHRLSVLHAGTPAQRLAFLTKYLGRAFLRESVSLRFRWVGEVPPPVKVYRHLAAPNLRRLGEVDWYIVQGWYQAYEPATIPGISARIVQVIQHYEDYADPRLRELVLAAYRKPSLIVTTSRANVADLTARGITVDGVVFLGINHRRFRPATDPRAPRTVLLYWGLEPRKGFDIGVAAMEKVRRRFPDVTVRLLCPVRGLPSPPGYQSVGAVSDEQLARVYRAHEIFVFPSLREGFGLPPLEAMACGCAVVTTAVGAVPEYAVHGENAYVVKQGDAEDLADAVTRILDDGDLRTRMSHRAQQTASHYTWERAAAALEDILVGTSGRT